ncbi:hypothetical protein [Tsukamurella paurometabola]|uniref:Calpain catalytic domain-containing protein n=1 Tax=Tsukamurella paurometabola TaxID=2061 RepID=A0ABS5NIV6_TSUPA|nr:hypothetical protein [Tsukamurella paurometabola]MBS4104203.1 hypothetical protein [Tsukamurella paurometabola]UEA84275.1 hypothetical protein LK411_05460 [Tsukamurella paurometabola]
MPTVTAPPNNCILNCEPAQTPAPPATQAPAPTEPQSGQPPQDGVQNQSDQNPPKRIARRLIDCDAAKPDEAVQSGLMNGGIPRIDTAEQGGLGDCWVLASFLGFQASEKGREGLAKMITPSAGGGYDVKFGSNCKPFHVDKVYSEGARVAGNQGAISILESAYSQTGGGAAAYLMCVGGFAFMSQQIITGGESEHHLVASIGNKVRDQVTQDHEKTNALIAEGRSVVLGTMKDMTFTTDVMRNGVLSRDETVKTLGMHQYAVTKATPDGVWVVNPWGPGNPADRGGEIWIPKDQINHSFSDIAISAPISTAFERQC